MIVQRIFSNFLFTSSIIFIHGLQGHPQETWSHRTSAGSEAKAPTTTGKRSFLQMLSDRGPDAQPTATEQTHERCVFWPFDLLRGDCPNARIITWGYDSVITRFFDGAANQGSIFAHARDLLFALSRARADCVRRPTSIVNLACIANNYFLASGVET